MQRTLAAAIGSALIIAPVGMSRAQTETDSAKAVRHGKAEASLAKAAQNPVANMVSLPLQWNFTSGGGLDSSTSLVLNVQPVLPLPIGERWLIVSRTVVPFVSLPLPNGRQSSGIADIQEQAYLHQGETRKVYLGGWADLLLPDSHELPRANGTVGAGAQRGRPHDAGARG